MLWPACLLPSPKQGLDALRALVEGAEQACMAGDLVRVFALNTEIS
jgi:hypothetical protein